MKLLTKNGAEIKLSENLIISFGKSTNQLIGIVVKQMRIIPGKILLTLL